jgi:hypothetical protein
MLGEKSSHGNKDSKVKVVIGYEWTPAVQGNPGTIYDAVDNLKKMASGASIQVVNRDADPSVPAGISVNGKLVMAAQPDGTLPNQSGAMSGLMSAIQGALRQP